MGEIHKEVRARSRGLEVLVALNRHGNSTAVQLAARTGINRTTIYRLLDTLIDLGFVARNMSDERFELLPAVRRLSAGFTDTDFISRIVAPELGRLFTRVLWPTDFAIFEGGTMQIRESTQRFSPYSVDRFVVGTTRMFTRSALGRAVLAATDPAERGALLRQVVEGRQPDASQAQCQAYMAQIVQTTMSNGYASSVGETEQRISAIALPVKSGKRVFGAVNLVFFSSTMSCEVAARNFLDEMRQSVETIEKKIAALQLSS